MHTQADIWQLLHTVPDPEVPVLSITDLGIVRTVAPHAHTPHAWQITITPTYTGCPAMHAIEQNIAQIMTAADITFEINTILAPAWTTDWITEQGRKKLLDYGIAPPQKTTASKRSLFATDAHIACPRCASTQTNMLSQFGSTACKALYQCQACHEPFDYFKCL